MDSLVTTVATARPPPGRPTPTHWVATISGRQETPLLHTPSALTRGVRTVASLSCPMAQPMGDLELCPPGLGSRVTAQG